MTTCSFFMARQRSMNDGMFAGDRHARGVAERALHHIRSVMPISSRATNGPDPLKMIQEVVERIIVLGRNEGIMGKQRHTAEQIITKLREAEVLTSKGLTVEEVLRQLGVSDATYDNSILKEASRGNW